MHEFNLSADAAISFGIGLWLLAVLTFSTVHELVHLQEKYSANRPLVVFINFSERQRERLLRITAAAYRLRWVTLFILCAMVVSTISPVSALVEVENNVIERSCKNLLERGDLTAGATVDSCKKASISQGYTYADLDLKDTRNHFIQVALWPAVLSLYGFLVWGFISFAKRSKGDEIEDEDLELIPHVHHIVNAALVVLMGAIGLLQNLLGT